MEKLKREKEVVGIYISGHPLDDFRAEMNYFCTAKVSDFTNLENFINREMAFGVWFQKCNTGFQKWVKAGHPLQ